MKALLATIVMISSVLALPAMAERYSRNSKELKAYSTRIFYFEGTALGPGMRTKMHVAHEFCRAKKGHVGANSVHSVNRAPRGRTPKIYITRIVCALTESAMSNNAKRSFDRVENVLSKRERKKAVSGLR